MNRDDIKKMVVAICHKVEIDFGDSEEFLEEVVDVAAKHLVEAFKNAMKY